ncbi:hypothetical protein DFH09DRAFT_1320926 [Mycena vulgaris]|nr:hypothetical protein DFH09DRAFT_1320926 [Mycena vulgaris]
MTTPPLVAGGNGSGSDAWRGSRCRSYVLVCVPRSSCGYSFSLMGVEEVVVQRLVLRVLREHDRMGKVCFRSLSFSSLALAVVGVDVGVGVVGRAGMVVVVLAPAMTRVDSRSRPRRTLPLRLSPSRPSALPPSPSWFSSLLAPRVLPFPLHALPSPFLPSSY